MSSNSDNIEERLIPFIEGVLNEREQREVKEAIKADPKLAREVEELREVIGDLRQAFASGVTPRSEEVSVEEVVAMASHDGKLESMPGSSEQKARLFCNDQALEEYRLLRSLTEDMQKTTLPIAEVPPMPDSLLAEIARYKTAEKVVEFKPKFTPEVPAVKGGFFGMVDRLNPKPLMAAAAAFALLSLGIHVYNTPPSSPALSESKQVSFGDGASATPGGTPISEVATRNEDGVVEPTGVTVFTSGDRTLLKEQAEKLLANKVRYTVTDDRILVSEREVAEARAVLWGDEEAAQVAMAEEKSSEEKLAQPSTKSSAPKMKELPVEAASQEVEDTDEFVPPKITHYDYRGKREEDGGEKKQNTYSSAEGGAAKEPEEPAPRRGAALGEDSALKRKSGAAPDEPNWTSPAPEVAEEAPDSEVKTGRTSASTAPEAARLKGASKEERERLLKAMALGESAGKDASVRGEVAAQDGLERDKISRSRVAEPYVENRPAPVANVITSDRVQAESDDKAPAEDPGGAVAVEKPRIVTGVRQAPPPAASAAPSRAPGASASESSSGGDVDLRMAMVLDSQAAVARRHNVVISVESSGGRINVYVRPNKEMSKAELDELRQVLRSELGLAASDSIVFR